MELVIASTGLALAIYDEAFEFAALGRVSIQRASHVEPNAEGEWLADLAPVGGPVLGPFSKPTDAMAAETAWLRAYWLTAERR